MILLASRLQKTSDHAESMSWLGSMSHAIDKGDIGGHSLIMDGVGASRTSLRIRDSALAALSQRWELPSPGEEAASSAEMRTDVWRMIEERDVHEGIGSPLCPRTRNSVARTPALGTA